VRIVVENMPGIGYSHFGGPGDLDLGELGLSLDTGHAAICGTLHDFLLEPRAKLAHVHLHDNRGPADTSDPHLPLGRGVVDAGAVIRAARARDATMILELPDEASIVESIAHLGRKGLLDGV
jgi:sugar phosphate isomerase/epimerase